MKKKFRERENVECEGPRMTPTVLVCPGGWVVVSVPDERDAGGGVG